MPLCFTNTLKVSWSVCMWCSGFETNSVNVSLAQPEQLLHLDLVSRGTKSHRGWNWSQTFTQETFTQETASCGPICSQANQVVLWQKPYNLAFCQECHGGRVRTVKCTRCVCLRHPGSGGNILAFLYTEFPSPLWFSALQLISHPIRNQNPWYISQDGSTLLTEHWKRYIKQ